MRAHFPDIKSAALACEQIASAGYPLSQFMLEKPKPAPERPVRHVSPGSLWDRIIGAFGSGSLQKQLPANTTSTDPMDSEDQPGDVVVSSVNTADAFIRSIVLTHGGYLEPPAVRPEKELSA